MSEWFKEHDWKSCVRLKRTGGSNPLLCAKKRDMSNRHISFLSSNEIRRGFEGGRRFARAKRFANAKWDTSKFMANWTIDNRPPGRAAKGENPLLCARK